MRGRANILSVEHINLCAAQVSVSISILSILNDEKYLFYKK